MQIKEVKVIMSGELILGSIILVVFFSWAYAILSRDFDPTGLLKLLIVSSTPILLIFPILHLVFFGKHSVHPILKKLVIVVFSIFLAVAVWFAQQSLIILALLIIVILFALIFYYLSRHKEALGLSKESIEN